VPAMLIALGMNRNALRASALMILGYACVVSPWQIRNSLNLGEDAPTTAAHAVISLHNGTYPGLAYNDDPTTRGFPHRFDPDYHNYQTYGAVLDKLWDNARKQPAKYLAWYLWGKPKMLFSWDIISGMGDVFIYSVSTSPYHTSESFWHSHQIMRLLHWPLMLSGLLCAILVWLPARFLYLPSYTLATARITSALLAYFIAIHVVTTPLPRYSIPLRPLLFLMAVLGVYISCKMWPQRLRAKRLEHHDS